MATHKKQVNINLIIKEDDQETFSGQFLSWVLTYGRYIIILIQIIVLSVFFLRFELDRDHTDLKESVSQKQALIQSVSDLETEIRYIQKRLFDIKQLLINQDATTKVLTFLQQNTPSDSNYQLISFSPPSIRFIATSKNLKSFNFLLTRIQQDNKFTDVLLEDLLRKPDGRVEFRVQATINFDKFN